MSIKVEFAVDMTCQSCVDDIGQILSSTAGVTAYDISLADKTVLVSGTASPTQLLNAFKDSGRSAVVRGAGSTNGNIGAAVCIFEEGRRLTDRTKGLARFVQVSDSLCFVDITVSGIPDGDHGVAIHAAGDLSNVPESCGPHWNPDNKEHGGRDAGHRGDLGNITVKDGWGDLTFETDRFKVWEIIGRSMVIAEGRDDLKSEGSSGRGILAGVVARSAGLFENDKQVCACSGNTLWTEQRLVDEGRRL
ncbi:copper chaperone for superoxide dismutase [Linderina pennispora]|uniref:Superoxide dismutase 1 copper chaperone n=1 Tax=Linderina pennispora TaxID=61395 RepID=A0A1Y1W442_9FUNG|nr:copper chaperone for superoxide dismutase [Linderina pennispora]ORX68006.1 copper chaperone for superoxide dismutase [Linderina pennispora]